VAVALRSALGHAIAAGELLIEAKAKVRHGQWLKWLAANCEVPKRTAAHYMALAKFREKLYALRFLNERQHAVNEKLRFARERSPWLESGRARMEPFDLGDGSRAALLPSGEVTGVARRFADLVGAGRATDTRCCFALLGRRS
jgi:hypothetical protein